MILLIGGAGQGKLAYALEKTGLGEADVARDPVSARTRPIFAGLETWVRAHPGAGLGDLLEVNPDVVILCDEVGCGVVPVDPSERVWREEVGRLCCALAQKAGRVERIFCGLSMVLKGEEGWK
ncbi:MAG TPA: bifunctional adenosylcobinamide kinase/adenosylcobinamide-phosphate guanylyltransferase [Candidatus Intestinimonas pullistercoris]|uniref:Bifunctional adenosylcobinamide kinase/adenosylcobinamide-phosphate guanylyltransferase n=1 Tax=Candidatus Intestinimonas pullistercoris TaxID=2838623 RepID=A0A9D2NZ49_9FIRM|nr:bifunctional adenosylcobinamide kinase/adenosylcobinamide-phosphate guanylyltransferase [uncultured Intestinimonas sp.]HJC41361.1 bifunctional adenosylcobinamide kinase/adenosylcobinamide-phosphate guanylyltransferase [Candidatus Intestinimonas pullistercoris]